jgi:colanic acid biosynthesis glycosyl transferase WcaI
MQSRDRHDMQRLIFVNRYFFPDYSATSQILSDLTFHLAAIGHEVHVITSRQRYDDPRAALPENEITNAVQVHRVASSRFGRATLSGRMLDYLSFYRSVRRRLHAVARPGDTIIAKTDPPLLSLVLQRTARNRGTYLVNWLQDIYPETAAVLGVPLIRGPTLTILRSLRNRSLRNADAAVVVGDLMARRIKGFGVPVARVHVIANWCDDETIRPAAGTDNPLREAWHLSGKFVIGHSGNLGRAHDFETVLGAAERLRNEPRIVFLMIGGGKHFEKLAKAVKARGLENSFRFHPYQERAMLPHSLGVADAHWLSLHPALEDLIVPSKFYAVAAAGKPMLMIGESEGEIGRLIREHRCGTIITPGDAATLADTLRRWAEQPNSIAEMGAQARQMLDARFTRRRAFNQWRQLIGQLASRSLSVDTPRQLEVAHSPRCDKDSISVDELSNQSSEPDATEGGTGQPGRHAPELP